MAVLIMNILLAATDDANVGKHVSRPSYMLELIVQMAFAELKKRMSTRKDRVATVENVGCSYEGKLFLQLLNNW